MPKKATKKKPSVKKVVTKKTVKSSKKVTQVTNPRDKFFADHPNARVLLGFFIVSVAILLGMLFYTYRLEVEIGKYLWETEGVVYNPSSN